MAKSKIAGITIEIGGDTKKLGKALDDVNKKTKSTQDELREINRLLKLDPKNTELLAQKQTLLKDAISATKEKLDVLKTAEAQVQEQFKKGEATEEQYRAVQREIIATENALKNLENQAASSNSKLLKAADAVEGIGNKATDLGKKLMPVSAGIAALGGAGVAAAMELDNGYDTIITKTGAAGEALEKLTEVADNVFSDLPTTMDDAGIAVGEINTRFGVTGERLEELSKDFIKFAEINGADLNNSIGTVDRIMEQWNIDMRETGNVLGLITKKGQDTGISVDALMNSVQQNGATFKEMGLNLTQSISLLAQFESNGVNAETAIAGLKKSVKNYTDEGKSTEEALKLTIESIKNAKTETEALAIAQDTFGTKGAAEMSKAIREGRIDIDSLSASMKEYGSVVNDTFEATLDPWDETAVAMNNAKLVAADLGQSLLSTVQPMITKVVEKVKEFTEWFKNLDSNTKQIIVKIGLLVAALGPALLGFGKMSTGISGVIKTVSGLGSKIRGIGGILSALSGPAGIVIGILAALAAGFVALYKTNDEFREKINNGIGKLKESFLQLWTAVQPLIESMKKAFNALMTALKPVFDFLMLNLRGIINGIVNAVDPIISTIQNMIDYITNIINAIVALLQGDFDGFYSYMAAALQNAIDFFKNTIMTWVNFIVGFFEVFGIDVKQIFMDIWLGICSVFQGVGQWFADRFSEAYTNVTNAFASIAEWFGARWTEVKTALINIPAWFKSQFDDAWANIQNAFANVTSFFSDLWSRIRACFVNIGVEIGNAVGDAFKTAINSCLATIEGVVNKFIGMINGVIDIINEIPGVSLGPIGELSLPRLAKGGILKEGTAMVAEAGPELLTMVNGKAVVTPLTGTAANRAVNSMDGGSRIEQNINITSAKALTPYEIGKQTRIQTRALFLAMQRRKLCQI